MLSNAYFLAKFRFDTAENEPAKNLQIFEKCNFEKCIFEKCILHAWERCCRRTGARRPAMPRRTTRPRSCPAGSAGRVKFSKFGLTLSYDGFLSNCNSTVIITQPYHGGQLQSQQPGCPSPRLKGKNTSTTNSILRW